MGFLQKDPCHPIIKTAAKNFPESMMPFFEARVTNIDPFIDHAQQVANFPGRMLQVIIHDNDNVSSGVIETGHCRAVLAKVFAKRNPSYKIVRHCQITDNPPTSIGTGVVDKQ
jgi:hypothetical protein